MKYLLTGACGFIGSNYALRLLEKGHQVVNIDKLTYAANASGFEKYQTDQYRLIPLDLSLLWQDSNKEIVKELHNFQPDYVIHLAAESMVDRSLENNKVFFDSNVLGTWALLELLKTLAIKKAIFFSTDEVYGSLDLESYSLDDPKYGFKTTDCLDPRNPYAGSKAAADQVTLSYIHNFTLPISLVRPTNNYGPRQHLEKFIPKAITNILQGKKVPVYGSGKYYREWMFVHDLCDALDLIIEKGVSGTVYNVGPGDRYANIEILEMLCNALQINGGVLEHVQDRPGHDKAYAVDSTSIRKLGWLPAHTLAAGLNETIEYYRALP